MLRSPKTKLLDVILCYTICLDDFLGLTSLFSQISSSLCSVRTRFGYISSFSEWNLFLITFKQIQNTMDNTVKT